MNANSTNTRFSLFDELDRGLNHLVTEVLNQDVCKGANPALTVLELENTYVVECDLPGVRLEEINLLVEDGVLHISGERAAPDDDEKHVTLNERTYGKFSRKLKLSKDVNSEGVDAELGNGVLRISIPKSDRIVPRQVKIRNSNG
ncbi:MAG: Hsp20/alpha crystallin family protein [Fuerstiella sp.]|nr:Hsp20/alpha crystallin family protein [Fuerstiella sp.]MCP4511833.1 Hsp20/alpha crystallin family protein [Fuerstiella sp.]